MPKLLIAVAALLLAGLPAAWGLMGNASFTREVPVRVPSQVSDTSSPSPTPGQTTSGSVGDEDDSGHHANGDRSDDSGHGGSAEDDNGAHD